MAWRRLAAVLLLASASMVAVAQVPGPVYLPEPQTSCWDCHAGAAVGKSPPVQTFLTIAVPEDVNLGQGQAVPYPVRLQNAWTADLTFLEPEVDLTQAPSLAFAADVPPIDEVLADTLTVDLTRPTEAQAKPNPVEVHAGLTRLALRLEPEDRDPVTGPDLALRIESGGVSVTVDRERRGGVEELDLANRADFSALGYGTWTVSAVLTPVRADAGAPDWSLPRTSVPFRLVVQGGADDAPERVLSLPSREGLAKGEATVATFHLLALRPPGPDEAVALRVRAHVHYAHLPGTAGAQDDADFVKDHAQRIQVMRDGDGARLSTDAVMPFVPAVHNGATLATIAEAIGYASAFLLLASTTAGGMFGKASRRWANGVFGSARRRVAFHNFLSYGLILAALAHTALFLVEAAYGWAVGLLWGGLAALCMLGLGVTGALQVPMIRRWSFPAWRWTHYALAAATIAFTVAHLALDGAHFAPVQEWLGWRDPVADALA